MKVLGVAGVLLSLLVLILGGLSTAYYTTNTFEGNVVFIEMQARQFEYNITTIQVTKGDLVRISIYSVDVVHGFAISEYNINIQIPVHSPVVLEFLASKAGVFVYYCTVFCGTGHASHRGQLIVAG